jgi:hypothetical protein
MPLPNNTTAQHQSSLAHYCRTGHYEPIPGVRDRHVIQYRTLVLNIVGDILVSAFPLTHALLEASEWEALVDCFLSDHPCQSAQVWKMPGEFYGFLSNQDHPLHARYPTMSDKYPFLLDLLYFEWLEIDLFMMEDMPVEMLDADTLVVNPEHLLQHVHYPVHLKNPADIRPEDKGDYFLVLFRHPDSGQVQYMDLSPALVYLIELLSSAPATQESLILELCAVFNLPANEDVTQPISAFISRGLENKLLLGYTKSTS